MEMLVWAMPLCVCCILLNMHCVLHLDCVVVIITPYLRLEHIAGSCEWLKVVSIKLRQFLKSYVNVYVSNISQNTKKNIELFLNWVIYTPDIASGFLAVYIRTTPFRYSVFLSHECVSASYCGAVNWFIYNNYILLYTTGAQPESYRKSSRIYDVW